MEQDKQKSAPVVGIQNVSHVGNLVYVIFHYLGYNAVC